MRTGRREGTGHRAGGPGTQGHRGGHDRGGRLAVVRLREDGDQLTVEVDDDGRGFDLSTTIRGNGVTNM
jgi:hypothetical protein